MSENIRKAPGVPPVTVSIPPDEADAFEARARLFKRVATASIFVVSGIMFVILIANNVLADYHTSSSGRQPSAFGWLCVLPVFVVVPLLRGVILGGPAKALAAHVTDQAGLEPGFEKELTKLLKRAPFSRHRFTLFGSKRLPEFEHVVKGRRVIVAAALTSIYVSGSTTAEGAGRNLRKP